MSEITAETLYNQITLLPDSEKLKLRELLDAQLRDQSDLSSQAKFVQPRQTPTSITA